MGKYWRNTLKCQYCGKPFQAKRYDAKYCPGGACRQAARRGAGVSVTSNLPGVTDNGAIHKKAGKSANLVKSIMLDLYRLRFILKTADQEQADATNELLKGVKTEINDLLLLRDKDAQSRFAMVGQYAARRSKGGDA